jgi:STE24 endopeptidase
VFSADEIDRSRAYHRPLDVVWLVQLAVDLVALAALSFTGLGDLLLDPLDGLPWWGQGFFATAAVIVTTTLLALPLAAWAGHLRERAWGFSTQSAGGWALDRLKGLVLSVVLGGLALVGLVGAARAFPDWWPVVVGAAAACLVVLLGFVAPLVLEPLFNRFEPLGDEELATSLRQLADDAGVPVEHVLVADASRRTTKQNAYVSGFGRTRRLVLYDTLLEDGDPRELRVVLAHELGHRRAGHIARGVALGAAGAAIFVAVLWALLQWQPLLDALGVSGAADPRVAPFVLLLATVLQLVASPAGAGLSRAWERQADRIALELTHDPGAFEAMMRRLALANLADLDPPRAVYVTRFSHPTPPERIAAARRAVATSR